MMANFIDGPLWTFSLVVFAIGISINLIRIILGARKVDYSQPRASALSGAFATAVSRFIPYRHNISIVPIQIFAGYAFHIGLFAVIFFAAPHVRFFEMEMLGFGWAALPHWAFIVAAQFAFIGLLMLWLHRLTNKVSRLISDADDHIASILVFVVMLTGCLALLESHAELRLLHRFTVELLLIYFPFSRLMHAFTFIPSRLFTGAWFGRRGIRS